MSESLISRPRFNTRALWATIITCILSWGCTWLSLSYFKDYSLGLFIWLPIVIGAVATMLYGFGRAIRTKSLRNFSFFVLFVYCLGLLCFAWEGVICLIMALPLGLFFAWTGHQIGVLLLTYHVGSTPLVSAILFISVPALLSFENAHEDVAQLRSIVTSIDIDAAPELVWTNVVSFPQLDEPEEFIFRTGIAYPINATIQGRGEGAIRHCNFSTGSFVEPITVWNEPRLLRFSVTQQPVPMMELSPYKIEPNHLHGYWVSKQGQFRLIPLVGGRTRLEGTTWYENRIRPGFYWNLWSDYIVHRIHKRVLLHIKNFSEHQK